MFEICAFRNTTVQWRCSRVDDRSCGGRSNAAATSSLHKSFELPCFTSTIHSDSVMLSNSTSDVIGQHFFTVIVLVISSHLPLAYCPLALLSFALTCTTLVPHYLYNNIRLVGEQVESTLKACTAKAQAITAEHINWSPSHCVHRL